MLSPIGCAKLLNGSKTCNYRNCLKRYSLRKMKNWYATLWKLQPSEPPYNHVTQIGDPVLRSKADGIPDNLIDSKEISFLVQHMRQTMQKYNSVGLSAPQLGIPLRLFALEITEKRLASLGKEVRVGRQMSLVPFSVFINPQMKILNYAKVVFPESCESVRGFSADVERYQQVEISAHNGKEMIKFIADGWTARVVQHEMDHLDGKLYTDIMHRRSLTCTCWEAVNRHNGKIELPFYPE